MRAVHPQKAPSTAIVASRSSTWGSRPIVGVSAAAPAPIASSSENATDSPSTAALIRCRAFRANRVTRL